ncbi:MAG: MarR family winged helix-turn-helix transcriptional regulator [Pseudomonadota bacterium]
MPHEVNTPSVPAADMRLYLRDEELDRGAGLILMGERALAAASEQARKAAGLTKGELQVLLSIMTTPGQDVSTLRARLAMTVPTCARLLGALDKRGLIARNPGGDDRRRRAIRLSEDGIAVLSPILSSMRKALREAYKTAGPGSVAGARSLLEAIAR